MSLDLIHETKPVLREGIGAIIIGTLIVASMVATDVAFHEDYLKVIIEQCHTDNQSEECLAFREKAEVGMTDQIEIGQKYWDRLFGQAIELFFILFLLRLMIGYFLQAGHVRRMRVTTLLIALVWGLSASVLFTFGLIDTFYFWSLGQNVPDTLDWLDGGLIFQESKTWFGTAEHVEKEDLYATNLAGLLIILGMIFITSLVYKENGYTNRGIP